jgi:uncharacterized membrane protein
MQKYIWLAIFLVIAIGCTTHPNQTLTGNAIVNDEVYVRIPISENLEKFNYDTGDVEVTYFIVKGADGEIRTAFDACDVCGGYKGYTQRDNDVVCNNCGRYFSIDQIGTENKDGGCWPAYLGHKIDEDTILISKSELAGGAYLFK